MFKRRRWNKYVEGNPSAESRGPKKTRPEEFKNEASDSTPHRLFQKRKVPPQIVMTTRVASSIHASSISRVNTLETLNLGFPPLDHGRASLTHRGG